MVGVGSGYTIVFPCFLTGLLGLVHLDGSDQSVRVRGLYPEVRIGDVCFVVGFTCAVH